MKVPRESGDAGGTMPTSDAINWSFLIKMPDKKLSRESFSIAGGIVFKIFLIESDASNRWPSRSIIPHG
jgi:hypothetical protein